MKKTLYITLIIQILFTSSCEIEIPEVWGCTDYSATNYDYSATEDDGTCIYPCYTGFARFNSYEGDPYLIRINNVSYGSISSYGIKTIELANGYYSAELTQSSGYIFSPTVYTFSFFSITGCETQYLTFGQK
jgi:hypothetical protein